MQAEAQTSETGGLKGFITDRHLLEAEEEFPGIVQLYLSASPRPPTFLDLVAKYLALH